MRHVIGMFESRSEAEQAIEQLKSSGIRTDSISVAMKDMTSSSDLAGSTGVGDLSAEGTTAGMVSGAAVGTLVGLALVGSNIVLPGVGTFLVGGPLAAALTGAGIGAASGGLIGALVGAGIPEEEAAHYSSGMERGNVVLAVDVSDQDASLVQRIFDDAGSRRTHST
jgi:uncharacterized membrane protein